MRISVDAQDENGEPVHVDAERPRGAHPAARDRPPRRRADDRSHDARVAPRGAGRPAAAARPPALSDRAVAVRVAFAGTNWWAAQALERLAEAPGLGDRARDQPARPPAGRGRKPAAPPVAAGGRRARPRARAARAAPPRRCRCCRRRGVEAVARGRLRRARAARAAGCAAVRQPASLGAAALARRGADRARADGRRSRVRRRGDAAGRGARRRAGRGAGALRGRAGRGCGRGLRPRARARAAAARARARRRRRRPPARRCRRWASRPTPPRSPRPTALLDPARPARELHDRVRALSPHIGARLALDGAPHTIWRTRVRDATARARGAGARRRLPSLLGCGAGALELCELQAPGGRRMPAADWLRGLRGALPAATARVSDARTLALRVLTRVLRRGRLRRSRVHGRGREGEGRRPRARARDAPRVRRGAAPAHAGRRARGDRRPPGAAARAAPRARPAAGRLPDPLRGRNPAACSGFRERRARAARHRPARDGSHERRAAAHRRRRPGVVRGAARGDARRGGAAPLAARLDRRAVVRAPTATSARGRCCAAANRPPALSLWPNPLRDGERAVEAVAARGRRERRPRRATGVLRVDGPLDVAGSQAFTERRGRADRPRGRAGRPARRARSPGMRVLDLCAAPGGKTAVLAATGAQVTAVDAHPARAKTLAARCAAWASRPRSSRPTAAPTAAAPSTASWSTRPAAAWASWPAGPTRAGAARPRTPRSSQPCRSELVRHARELLAPGGELHFAVCTLNPQENEAIAPRPASKPRATSCRTWPDEGDDGFYARARLVTGLARSRCACRRP